MIYKEEKKTFEEALNDLFVELKKYNIDESSWSINKDYFAKGNLIITLKIKTNEN